MIREEHRRWLIKMLTDRSEARDYYYLNDEDKKVIVKALQKPEIKHGRWIDGEGECPVCGEDKFKDLYADIWADWKPPFCPNCGADMRGKQK